MILFNILFVYLRNRMGIDLIMNRLPFILIFKTIYRKSSDISMLKGIWFYLLDFIMAVGIALSNFFFYKQCCHFWLVLIKKILELLLYLMWYLGERLIGKSKSYETEITEGNYYTKEPFKNKIYNPYYEIHVMQILCFRC